MEEYNGVLGIDLGLRNPVVSVALPSRGAKFRGQEVKQVQSKYFYLRRRSETGKGWRRREHDKIRDLLHKLTTKIADYAERNRLLVAVGDLSGIQKRDRGRIMNRKLHRFPHYSVRQMMEYKCKERGIEYVEVDEAYTSQKCSRCGEMGNRRGGEFVCPDCGLEIDADVNGARNIAGRALGKSEIRPLVNAGAPVTVPRTLSVDATSEPSSEATSC